MIKSPEKQIIKTLVAKRLSFPEGISLSLVLGFLESKRTSAILLNPIAALLAPTMAIRIQKNFAHVSGAWRWAKNTAERAKGSAKIVWLNRIIRPNVKIRSKIEDSSILLSIAG